MNDRQAHITHFEPRTHRVQVIAPSRGNSSGNRRIDFITNTGIRLHMSLNSVNWWKTGMLLGCVLCACLMATGIAGLLGLWGYGR